MRPISFFIVLVVLVVVTSAVGQLPKTPTGHDVLASQFLALLSRQPNEAVALAFRAIDKEHDPVAQCQMVSRIAGLSRHSCLNALIKTQCDRIAARGGAALEWLLLSEMHRVDDQDNDRRFCLHQASTRHPKDIALLHEIARNEAECGLVEPALETLTKAAKLDRTRRSSVLQAYLKIRLGDGDAGWASLQELAKEKSLTREETLHFVDGLCATGRWDRAVEFIEGERARWPEDLLLRLIHAIALEECGRDDESLEAFISLIGTASQTAEMGDWVTKVAESTASDIFGRSIPQPPGAARWTALMRMGETGYAYRKLPVPHVRQFPPPFQWPGQIFGGHRSGFVINHRFDQSMERNVIAHLLRFAEKLEPAEKAKIAARLKAAGLRDVEILMEIGRDSKGVIIDEALLARHPEHIALHAAWMADYNAARPKSPAALSRCFRLFRDQHAELAFEAGKRALAGAKEWKEKHPDETPVVISAEELAAHGERLVKPSAICLGGLNWFLRGFRNVETHTLDGIAPATAGRLALLMKRAWDAAQGTDPTRAEWLQYDASVAEALVSAQLWPEAMTFIEVESQRPKLRKSEPGPPEWRGAGTISGGRLHGPHPELLHCPVAQLGFDHLPLYFFTLYKLTDKRTEADRAWMAKGLGPLIPKIANSGLRMVLEFFITDREGKSLTAEIERRLAQKSPDSADWELGGWLAQYHEEWPKACEHLQRAVLAADAINRQASLDENLVACLGRWSWMPKPDKAAMRPYLTGLIERARKRGIRDFEKHCFADMAWRLGFEDLRQPLVAETIRKNEPLVPRAPFDHPYAAQPRTPSALEAPSQRLERLAKSEKDGAAVIELSKQLSEIAARWLTPAKDDRSTVDAAMDALNEGPLKNRPGLLQDALKKMSSQDPARYAAALELAGRTNEARDAFLNLAKSEQPPAGVFARLSCLDTHDVAQSARWLGRVPDEALPGVFAQLALTLSGHGPQSETPQRQHVARLLTAWVIQRAAANLPLPKDVQEFLYGAPNDAQQGESWPRKEFPEFYHKSGSGNTPMRQVHDDLCRALLRFPETAGSGFKSLAGMAMHEGTDLKPIFDMAMQLLRRLSEPDVKQQRERGFGHGSSAHFETEFRIASPSPAFVAAQFAALQSADLLEREVLPVIASAEGANVAADARAYAQLFTTADAGFAKAAAAWITLAENDRKLNPGIYGEGGRMDEIMRVWRARKLTCVLDALFDKLSAHARETGRWLPPQTMRLVAFISDRDGDEAGRKLARKFRDAVLGADAQKRRPLFADALTNRSTSDHRDDNSESGLRARNADEYQIWLSKISHLAGHANTFTPLLMEDGLKKR